MALNDRAGKAALLKELMGGKRPPETRKTGVSPDGQTENADPASIAWHRNRLIEKFRERGLIPSTSAAEERTSATTKPSLSKKEELTNPDFAPGALGTRLAKHLSAERIADEHPAVIALLLRSQPANLRSEILRSLPGPQARSVMRVLRSGRPQANGNDGVQVTSKTVVQQDPEDKPTEMECEAKVSAQRPPRTRRSR